MPYHLENVQITSYQLGVLSRVPIVNLTFLADPIGALRRQGIAVAPEAEPAWRQFASALQALERATARSGTTGVTSSVHFELQISS